MSKIENPIPAAALAQHTIVLGKTRSGKSSAMRFLVEDLLDKQEPVCIIDPKGDWWGLKASASGKSKGYPVIIFGGEHADVPIDPHAGAAVAELFATGNRPCIIDLGGWKVEDTTRFFVDFASTLFRTIRGTRRLVIDEVHNFCPKGKVWSPQAGMMLHWANRLASEGLGKGILMLAASQRPQKVHNDFLTSCEFLIAMRVIHKSDRDAINDWIKGAGVASEVFDVNALASLKRGEAWAWAPEAEFGPVRVQFPLFHTYDSFRAQISEVPAKLKGWAGIDLAEVQKKLAAVVEEAKANDPELLKARIRELEAQARKQPKESAVVQAAGDAFEKALAREIRKRDGEWRDAWGMLGVHFSKVKRTADSIRESLAFVDAFNMPAAPSLGSQLSVRVNGYKRPAPVTMAKAADLGVEAYLEGSTGAGEVRGTPLKILKGLSEFESLGVKHSTRAMIARWCGVKGATGSFKTYISTLRSRGLIEGTNDAIKLTSIGRQAAPASRAPSSREELFSKTDEVFGGTCAQVFRTIASCYPEEKSRDEIAAMMNLQVSGSFKTYISTLLSSGMVVKGAHGIVLAVWVSEI